MIVVRVLTLKLLDRKRNMTGQSSSSPFLKDGEPQGGRREGRYFCEKPGALENV